MRPPSVDHRRHVRRGRRTRSGAEEEEEVRPHLDRAAGGQATGMAAWGFLLLPVVATICLASDEAEQRPLPIELGITESIVMTDRDELYVSPSVQYFRLPDQGSMLSSDDDSMRQPTIHQGRRRKPRGQTTRLP